MLINKMNKSLAADVLQCHLSQQKLWFYLSLLVLIDALTVRNVKGGLIGIIFQLYQGQTLFLYMEKSVIIISVSIEISGKMWYTHGGN